MTIISSIFNLLTQNHKFQLLTIKLESIEWKLKQTITPLKLPITENNIIYLPTTEAETLVKVRFLLRERDIYGFDERKGGLLVRGGAANSRTKKKERKRRTKKEEQGIYILVQ